MKRRIKPEWLDELPPDDPRAVRSRKDLRRLNRWMRHAGIFAAELQAKLESPPSVIVELGAGDGTLLLQLAAQMNGRWPAARAVLVDRHPVAGDATLRELRRFGWQAEVVVADAFDWAMNETVAADVILANLFLHHFEESRLASLFQLLARRTRLLVACETRRDWPSLAISPFFGLMGCGPVTRHDAAVSMKAGFLDGELSALWPRDGGWRLTERRAGLFTHLFVAQNEDKG